MDYLYTLIYKLVNFKYPSIQSNKNKKARTKTTIKIDQGGLLIQELKTRILWQ